MDRIAANDFVNSWNAAATTSLGLFWMALWAFGLGYLIASMIQVFVTRDRMQRAMGGAGWKGVALGTGFGFISSSCSFAALATTRSLFAKGAGFVPSLAFLLASTNLVIELGIVIGVFLTWQFVVGEYLGGLLLIGLTWLVVRLTFPKRLIEKAREKAREAEGEDEDSETEDWRELIGSKEGWSRVANRYVMEWRMVRKDVTVGFTVAGIVAAFVPPAFFQALFVGAGRGDVGLWEIVMQTLVGPLAAFFTFIGSMGNIPLAAVLFGHGVGFAGVMAFIFSDLVVLPVLRIQAKYYGWKAALCILGVFLVVLVAAAVILHYAFALAGFLPDPAAVSSVTDRQFFAVDYTLFLNCASLALSAAFVLWKMRSSGFNPSDTSTISERILRLLSLIAFLWLAGGLVAPVLV